MAMNSGMALPSNITQVSDGPDNVSRPTSPHTTLFAAATSRPPTPTILSTWGMVSVPRAIAAIAHGPPTLKMRFTPRVVAAVMVQGSMEPSACGAMHITTSSTPATSAGMVFVKTSGENASRLPSM